MPDNLEQIRRKAGAMLGSAVFELRMESARLAPTDVIGSLHLAQLSARTNRELIRGQLGLRQGPVSPEAPDPWLLAAARLHDAVSDAMDLIVDLHTEVEDGRRVAVPAHAAQVHECDTTLFGFVPDPGLLQGWTDPQACFDLGQLRLTVGSFAWRRRACIVEAVDAWAREHQAGMEAAGSLTLLECCQGLYRVQVEIREAVRRVRPGTMAASRAAARVAARSLVEMGDDAGDLPAIARARADTLDSGDPDGLAWHAIAGLLGTRA